MYVPFAALLAFLISAIGIIVRLRGKLAWWDNAECYDGLRISVRRKSARIVRLRIGVEVGSAMRLIISHERWFDKFLKALMLAAEPQTGRAQFDRDFYFACTDPRWVARLGQNGTAMQAVRSILQNRSIWNAPEIVVAGGILWVEWNAMRKDSPAELLCQVREPLLALKAWIMDCEKGIGEDPKVVSQARAGYLTWLVMQGFHFTLAFCGIFLWIFMFASERCISRIDFIAVPALAFLGTLLYVGTGVLIVRASLKANPYTAKILKDLFMVGSVAMFMVFSSAFDAINHYGVFIPGDATSLASPQFTYATTAQIDGLTKKPRRRSQSYDYSAYVTIEGKRVSFDIDQSQYETWKCGTPVTMVQYRGLMGDHFWKLEYR